MRRVLLPDRLPHEAFALATLDLRRLNVPTLLKRCALSTHRFLARDSKAARKGKPVSYTIWRDLPSGNGRS